MSNGDDDDDREVMAGTGLVPFRPALSDGALGRLYEATVRPVTDPIEVVFKIVYLSKEETEADIAAAHHAEAVKRRPPEPE